MAIVGAFAIELIIIELPLVGVVIIMVHGLFLSLSLFHSIFEIPLVTIVVFLNCALTVGFILFEFAFYFHQGCLVLALTMFHVFMVFSNVLLEP